MGSGRYRLGRGECLGMIVRCEMNEDWLMADVVVSLESRSDGEIRLRRSNS